MSKQTFTERSTGEEKVNNIVPQPSRSAIYPRTKSVHLDRHHAARVQGQLGIRNEMAQISNKRNEPVES